MMRMQKVLRGWILVAALISFFPNSSFHAKEVYQWVDEKGTIHFSEDESNVPEEQRDHLEKKFLPEEARQPEEKAKVRRQERRTTKDGPAVKEKEKVNKNRIEGDVIESVKTILSLWKDRKYSVLYGRGDRKSRMAVNQEDFEQRMTRMTIGLASSWETLRDIEVDVKNATLAYATVKIGLKPVKGGETKFRTETYRMSLENGMWRIGLAKILRAKI